MTSREDETLNEIMNLIREPAKAAKQSQARYLLALVKRDQDDRDSSDSLTRVQKVIVWAIDLGFITYWLLISLKVLPAELMFTGYAKAEVQAWNWSFLPLDLLASVTGILGNTTSRLDRKTLLTVSLVLTSVAGGMALGYWTFMGDFEISWWLPNLFLLVFPIWPLANLARRKSHRSKP